jgi:hypothetical protein
MVASRKGSIREGVELLTRRIGIHTALNPALGHLTREINKLMDDLTTQWEIEAIELGKRKVPGLASTASIPSTTATPWRTEATSEGGPKGATDGAASGFTHSEDYRCVAIRGKTHTLTVQQAQMIEILHEAQKNRNPDVAIAYILERLEKNSSRWQDTWRSNPDARRALVKEGKRKGTLRLNL